MKLYEYEAKALFSTHGVPIPLGEVVETPQQAAEAAKELCSNVVVKAQVLVASRGKAGGVIFVENAKTVEAAGKLLGTQILGSRVAKVLVEEQVPIKRELYFGITVDRLNRSYVAIASGQGGTDLEELAKQKPTSINREPIDQLMGFRDFKARQLAKSMGYDDGQMLALAGIFEKVYQLGMELDAELIEMNPLVETQDGKFVAVDTRIIIDDNALFRHSDYSNQKLAEPRDLGKQEFEALRNGLEYVRLEGNIGVLGNGAGLVMATMDLVAICGGQAANFLDMGGGAPPDRIEAAFRIILSNPQVKVLFVNILGGITLCDEVARGIIHARQQLQTTKPFVIRLVGTNEAEGKRILADAGLQAYDSMEDAAKKAVELAKEKQA